MKVENCKYLTQIIKNRFVEQGVKKIPYRPTVLKLLSEIELIDEIIRIDTVWGKGHSIFDYTSELEEFLRLLNYRFEVIIYKTSMGRPIKTGSHILVDMRGENRKQKIKKILIEN